MYLFDANDSSNRIEEDVFNNDMMLIFEPVLHLKLDVLPNTLFSVVDNSLKSFKKRIRDT